MLSTDRLAPGCQGRLRCRTLFGSTISASEPQPDFALLRPRADFYRGAHARPADVLLLIEVADTSLDYDRAVKRALYARHAIPEFWIVDLTSAEVEVCREPGADGYAAVVRVSRDGVLEPERLPGVRIQASALFR